MALGVENLKKVLVATLHLANKIDEVTQDGFQPFSDLAALLPNLVDGVSVIKNAKDAWAEFKDLDEAEREEILAYVKEEFDIADDILEGVIEKALDTISAVADLVVTLRDALKSV